MLAVTDTKEPSLVVSYLPNLTSASQPMNGAKSDETTSAVKTNVGEAAFRNAVLFNTW